MALVPADGGGGTGTPGGYKVQNTYADIEQAPGGAARDIERVEVLDQLYGIYFGFSVPLKQFQEYGLASEAQQYTAFVQQAAAIDGVSAIYWAQDINPRTNLLVDMLFITVTDPTGAFSTTVEIPLQSSLDASAYTPVNTAYQNLLKFTS